MSVTKTKSSINGIEENDRISRDFLWSIFVTALNSYRHDTVLRPFPSFFINENGEKDFDSLKNSGNSVLSLESIPPDCEELVKWVMNTKHFSLVPQNENKLADIISKTRQTGKVNKPTHIFEVIYDKMTEDKFLKIRGDRNVFYAYHGSRLENFHSILRNGLQNHLNKNSLFGDGTYVSTELSVCMVYSPSALSWRYSSLGDHLGCIAVCEIIDHPEIKSQTRKPKPSESHRWAFGSNKVPEKYYIVQNDELIRIKYLLVYSSTTCRKTSRVGSVKTWIASHAMAVVMVTYVAILLCIGMCNSRSFNTFYRKHFSLE